MDTLVTVTGNLTADPVQRLTANGAIVVGLRIASSSRRWDREAMQWRDGDAMFISASCWRALAGNVLQSGLRKGDSVVVVGRLSMRTYDDRQGGRRSVHEIDAVAVGPDLTRFPVDVRRPLRPAEPALASGEPAGGAGMAGDRPEGAIPVQPAGPDEQAVERSAAPAEAADDADAAEAAA